MYYAYFGLKEAPFRITPNTDLFFAGGNRGAILEALIYAISQGEGIVKVTGEVGTGKTMLCSMLQSRLPPHIETVYLAHPSVSPEEILHAIAFELQLNVPRDAGRMEVTHALYNYLLERHAQGKQVVIFVEESQNMPIATLEEVRLLSNLETGKHKLLQIILFGQPELDENLRQPNIRQLRERITHSFALGPLPENEIGEYLMFRLRAVGYRGPDLFSRGVVKQIARASQGLTRRINLIADKALLAAYAENTHTIKPKHVQAAIRDSEFARDRLPRRGSSTGQGMTAGITVALVMALGASAGYYYFANRVPPPREPTMPTAPKPGGDILPVQSSTAAASSEPSQQAQPTIAPVLAEIVGAEADPAPPSSSDVVASGRITPVPTATADAVASTQQAQFGILGAPATSVAGMQAIPTAPVQQSTGAPTDTLEARMQATSEWLRTHPPDTHSIQLLGSENAQQLKNHLNIIAKLVEINNIFVYRTLAKEKPFLTVLYGSFGSREAAQQALELLPPQLRAYRPYLRTVQGIRDEMSRNNTLQSTAGTPR